MPINEYDQAMADLASEGVPEFKDNVKIDPVDQAVNDARADQRQQIRTAVNVGTQENPDEAAKYVALAAKTNLPVEIVKNQYANLSKMDQQDSMDFDSIIKDTPALAQYLQDPAKAAVSHDDIDALKEVEKTSQDYGFMRSMVDSFNSGMATQNANLARIPGYLAQTVGLPVYNNLVVPVSQALAEGVGSSYAAEKTDRVPDWLLNNPISEYYDKLAADTRSPDLDVGIVDSIKKGDYDRAARAMAAQVVTNSPQQALNIIGAMATGPLSVAMLGVGGLTTASQTLKQNLDAGVDPTTATINSTLQGAFEIGGESVGTFGFLHHWEGQIAKEFGKQTSKQVMKSLAKTMGYAFLSEGTEEAVTQVAQDYTAFATGADPNALEGMGTRAIEAGLVGAFSGLTMTGPSTMLAGIQSRNVNAKQAELAKNFYTAIGEKAAATKTSERFSEFTREFVDQASDGAKVNIGAPAFEAYFQKKNIDPAKAAQDIGISKQYDEAKETGGDITVPMGQWVEKLAKTEHYAGLANDVRLNTNELSAAEGQEDRAKLKEEMKQLAQPLPDSGGTAGVEAIVSQKLAEAGLDSKYAPVFRFVAVLAEREGQDPIETLNNYALKFNRGMAPEGAGQVFEQSDAWKKEGYEIYTAHPLTFDEDGQESGEDPNVLEVYAQTKNGQDDVGSARFRIEDGVLIPDDSTGDNAVSVKEAHRRKGLAAAMYAQAEKETGLTVRASGWQTPAGKALWNDPNRPFGTFNQSPQQSPADRLARAKEAGFDTDTVYYHGTQNNFEAFKPGSENDWDAAMFGAGVYVSSDPGINGALPYAGPESATGSIMPLFVKAKKTFDVKRGDYDKRVVADIKKLLIPMDRKQLAAIEDNYNLMTFLRESAVGVGPREFTQILQKHGYDSVREDDVLALFDPSQIRSVNAQFDPAKSESPNILYQSANRDDRIARAEAEGFDTDTTWYHGTKADIQGFSKATLGASTGAGSARLAHFFASSPETASDYAMASDSKLSLRGKATEAELTAQREQFVASMREKYGSKWVSKLTTEEKTQRKELNSGLTKASEDQMRETASAAKLDLIDYHIDDLKKRIEQYKGGANDELRTRTENHIKLLQDRLDNYDWVRPEGQQYYNLIDKKTGEKLVNPALKDNPGSEHRFFDSPERAKASIEKGQARLEDLSPKGTAATVKSLEADLKEYEAQKRSFIEAEGGETVYPVHLKLKNPKIVDFEGKDYRETSYRDLLVEAKEQGHDGVIFKNTYDPAFIGPGANREMIDVAAVFEPQQIRSTFAAFRDFESGQLLAQGGDKPLGQIKFGDNSIDISVFENANLSTVIHEAGHFYFKVLKDFGTREGATEQTKGDLKTMLEWLGAESTADLTVDQEEQLARGFEAFIMEGKAPTKGLRKAFRNFRNWMLSVYQNLTNLNVNLTDEVRDVFARSFAAENEIQEVEKALHHEPLFSDPIAAGMNEKQAEKYIKARDEARAASEEELSKRLMKPVLRAQEESYQKKREGVRSEVEALVNKSRVYQALAVLQKGTNADGSPLAPGTPALKLSRASLTPEQIKALPRGLYSREHGVTPDIAAQLFGFNSGDELIETLSKAPKMTDLIEQETDKRMNELEPDIMTEGPQALRDQAIDAVHSRQRGALLRMELEHLMENNPAIVKDAIRRVARRVPTEAEVRTQAQQIVADKVLGEVKPYQFQRAEVKAAREAGELLAKGDIAGAFEAKRRELLNHELYRAAVDVQELSDNVRAMAKKVNAYNEKESKSRDANYVLAARSLLAQYGLGTESQNKKTADYLAQLESYDVDVFNTVKILTDEAAANAGPYKQASVSAVSNMLEAVQSLWDLSRSSREMEIGGQKITNETVKTELVAQAVEHTSGGMKPGMKEAVTELQKTKMGLLGIKASLLRIESWALAFDVERLGPAVRYLTQPIFDATTKYRSAKESVILKYAEILKKYSKDITRKPIQSTELGYQFADKLELMMAVLHSGNDSNLSKLLRGRGWGSQDENGVLDRSRWDAFIDRMHREGVLQKADYEFAQNVWNLMESFKPDAQRTHKKLYGHYFNEITARAFDTPFGRFEGGYIPAKTDALIDNSSAARSAQRAFDDENPSNQFPTTGRGFSKNRVEQFAGPLSLEINMLASHMDSVLRFTYIEPAVKQALRVIKNPDVINALDGLDKGIVQNAILPWLERTATQRKVTSSESAAGKFIDGAAAMLRRNVGLQIMFGNVVNSVENMTGLVTVMAKVAPRHVRNALVAYTGDHTNMVNSVLEKSEFMRTLQDDNMQDAQEAIKNIVADPSTFMRGRDFVLKHGRVLQKLTQNVSNFVAWGGAYAQAVEQGHTEDEAVQLADSTVRTTQDANAPESVSAFAVGSPVWQLFTQFSDYFNMLGNLNYGEFTRLVRESGLRKGAGKYFYVYMASLGIPAILSALLRRASAGKFDEDDDDEYLDDVMDVTFGSQVRLVTALVPFFGPLITAAANSFNDKQYDDRVSLSPAVQMIEKMVKIPADVYKAIDEGQLRKGTVKDMLMAIGTLSGLPTGPIGKPVGYLMDLDSGKADAQNPFEFTRGMITGKGTQGN